MLNPHSGRKSRKERPVGNEHHLKAHHSTGLYPPRLIAGLVPHADGPMYTDMRRALDERRELIEARTDAVLDAARDAREAWTKPLGVPPRDSRKATAWRRHARTVAAYRDRYRITDDTPLGWPPQSTAQKIDAARARTALDKARDISREHTANVERSPVEQVFLGPSL